MIDVSRPIGVPKAGVATSTGAERTVGVDVAEEAVARAGVRLCMPMMRGIAGTAVVVVVDAAAAVVGVALLLASLSNQVKPTEKKTTYNVSNNYIVSLNSPRAAPVDVRVVRDIGACAARRHCHSSRCCANSLVASAASANDGVGVDVVATLGDIDIGTVGVESVVTESANTPAKASGIGASRAAQNTSQ